MLDDEFGQPKRQVENGSRRKGAPAVERGTSDIPSKPSQESLQNRDLGRV